MPNPNMDFDETIGRVAAKLGATVEAEAPGRSCVLSVSLDEERSQRIHLTWDGEVLRLRTQCSHGLSDDAGLNLYRYLLRKNHELALAAFALDSDGRVELVWSFDSATCSADHLALALENLAAVGDFMERKFTGPDQDLF